MTTNLNTSKESQCQWFALEMSDLGLMRGIEIDGFQNFEDIQDLASYKGKTAVTGETNYLYAPSKPALTAGWILAPIAFAQGGKLVVPEGTEIQCLEFEILEWMETYSGWEGDTSYTGTIRARFQVL